MTTFKTYHGVNLTGWLTLESWVTPELFAGTGALTEKDLMDTLSAEHYQALVTRHRKDFIDEHDFKQIAARGFNAVRLPVPWYVFGDKGSNPGNYVGCLDELDQALEWAEEYSLKVLFVLAINFETIGVTRPNSHDLSNVRLVRQRALDVMERLCAHYQSRLGFLGIEVADVVRAQRRRGLRMSDGVPGHMLRNYYREAYDRIREVAGEDALIVLPDGGISSLWHKFMAQRRYDNVWLACHMDQVAKNEDGSSPAHLTQALSRQHAYLEELSDSALPVMVSSWSNELALASSTLTPEGRIAMERIYTAQQLDAYESCSAWFYQTWKTSTLMSGWDARVAFSTFERGMF